MIKSVWKCINIIAISHKKGMEQAEIIDTFWTYDFQPWAGIHKQPHQAEVAVGKGIARPHPDYKAPHGLFGRLVELDQLLQLVAHGHRVFGPSILRPEQLLRRAPLLSPVELHGVRHTAGNICKRSWRAPNSGK